MIQSIPIRTIDQDDTLFRISEPMDTSLLQASIADAGLIAPPLVRETARGFSIISGFRRIRACDRLGLDTISVRRAEKDRRSDLDYAFAAISANAFARELTTMELVRGVMLLNRFLTPEAIAERSHAVFNQPMNLQFVIKLLKLGSMPDPVLNLVASGNLSMPAALRMYHQDPATLLGFIRIFTAIKTGLNKQLEILTNVHEIAARERLAPLDVLTGPDVAGIVNDSNTDASRKGNLLRALLAARRFPEITKKNLAFNALVKSLHPGPDIRLMPPANFESTEYTLSLTFSTRNQLKASIGRISEMIDQPAFSGIVS